MAKINRDENYGDIIEIPGTTYGCRWEGTTANWTLYELVTRKNRDTKEKYTEWGNAKYPVSFAHMAEIICRGAGVKNKKGKHAENLQELLDNIILERQNMENILADIIRKINCVGE